MQHLCTRMLRMLTTYWSTLSYRGLGSLCGGAQQDGEVDAQRARRTCGCTTHSGRECVFL